MKVAFAGTPAFAARALESILAAGHHVPLVLTQPDRPAGRGMKLQESPVKTLAQAHGLALHQPASLRDAASREPLAACGAQALVVAAYGLILPQAVLDLPPLGCVNIHASLLPRWRGAAPIQRALLAGDRETGITLMRMEAGLDTGPMYEARAIPIRDEDSAASLHDRLAELGAAMIVELLPRLADTPARPQDDALASYAPKLERAEAELDWTQPAPDLARRVRAFNPVPGAWTTLDGQVLKIWAAEALGEAPAAQPGTVIAAGRDGLRVACGGGALALLEVQKAGGRRLPAAALAAGAALAPGTRLGAGR